MSIKEYPVNIPIIVTNFTEHINLKNDLLKLIDQIPNKEKFKDKNDVITKTDWAEGSNDEFNYLKYVKPFLVRHVSEIYKKYNVKGIRFGNFWFQQYTNGDTHDWNIHGYCHVTHVYFLELPESDFKTQIQNFTGQDIEYEAKDGDILSFPSCLYHKSPVFRTNLRKTIISFNTNFL